MMPSEPFTEGNPVFSVHQTDIIAYGVGLADYLTHEFLFTEDEMDIGHCLKTSASSASGTSIGFRTLAGAMTVLAYSTIAAAFSHSVQPVRRNHCSYLRGVDFPADLLGVVAVIG